MSKRIFFLTFVIFLFSFSSLFAEKFEFKYEPKSSYRILGVVSEDILVNGRLSHHSEITNKISVEVTQTKSDKTGIAAGELKSTSYVTDSFTFQGQNYSNVVKTYNSLFLRNKFGTYSEDEDDIMPVVRNAPIFPNKEIEIGESWYESGYEVHDFSSAPYYLTSALKYPINVCYTYLGKDSKDGYELDKISIKYDVFHNFRGLATSYGYGTSLKLIRISGSSNQILWWDNAAGRPYFYEEEFDLVITNSDRSETEFVGIAKGKVVEAKEMNQKQMKSEIQKELEESGLGGVQLIEKPEGLVLVMDNIKFYPDSADYLPGEEKKLETVAKILNNYKDRDIKVSGHTAKAGSVKDQDELSLLRATVVADYLIKNNVRNQLQVLIEGKGSREPVASNSNEVGRQKNRRVEIMILKN